MYIFRDKEDAEIEDESTQTMLMVTEKIVYASSACVHQGVCERYTGHNLLQHCSGRVGSCSESSHLTSLISGSNESLTIDQCQGATPLCPLNQFAL